MSVSSYSKPADPATPGGAQVGGPRNDCGAILGTAFRSPEEHAWYDTNCSHWPLTKFGDAPVAAGPIAAGCAAMAGKPYGSPEARNWYLQNCTGPGAAAAQANPNTPPPPPGAIPGDANVPPPGGQLPVPPAPVAQPIPPAPAGVPAPDRHDCNAIRGTAYNSATERSWYLTNCSPPVQTNTIASVPPAPTAQAPVYPSGQLPSQAYSIQATTLCGLPIGAVDQSLQALHKQICGN